MPASNPLVGEVWLCARHPPQYQPPPGLPIECPFYCLVSDLERSPFPPLAPPDRVVVICPRPNTPRDVSTLSLRYVSIPRELFLGLFEFQLLTTNLTRELIVFLDTWRLEQRALTRDDTYRMHPYRALAQGLIPLPEEPVVRPYSFPRALLASMPPAIEEPFDSPLTRLPLAGFAPGILESMGPMTHSVTSPIEAQMEALSVDDMIRTMAQIIGLPASAQVQLSDVPRKPERTQWEYLLDDDD